MNYPQLQDHIGPYTGISRAASRRLGGLQLTLMIYGAYNAMGLIGSESNGILILNEGAKDVLADQLGKVDSGYYGPTPKQHALFITLCTCEDATFIEYVNNSKRNRYEIALSVQERTKRRRADMAGRPTTEPDTYFERFEFKRAGSSTIEDKQRYLYHFTRFVRADFKDTLFPDWFYKQTSYMWGHIAHFNRGGFFNTWFSTTHQKVAFLERCSDPRCIYGDPAYTYVDVERALLHWLKETDVLGQYRKRYAREIEAAERAQLDALKKKYNA